MTLAEVMVASFIMGIVGIVFTSALASVQKTVDAQSDRSINNDQARLALEQLDREIRSGNILYDPLSDNSNGYRLRVYTQSNGIPFRCVEWRVQGEKLLRREREPGYGLAWPTTWRTVAENIQNVAKTVKAFQLDTDPTKGSRTLDVTLLVNSTPSNPSTLVTVQGAITGRNTLYGYPLSVCDPAGA